MKFYARVGLWHDKAQIQFAPAIAANLFELWGTRQADLVLIERTLLLAGCPEKGRKCFRIVPDKCGGDAFGIALSGSLARDTIARFELHEMEFAPEPTMPGTFRTTIPADHELPWPRLHASCKAYYGPDEILRQVMMRRRSALSAGLRRMPHIPDQFVALLDDDYRRKINEDTRQMARDMGVIQ